MLRADALVFLSRSVRSQIEPTVGKEQGELADADPILERMEQARIVELFRRHYTAQTGSAQSLPSTPIRGNV